MALVVDCSVTMSWCFRDEATRYTEDVFDRLRGEPAVVPAIWPLEVANTLLVAERRGRITGAEGMAPLASARRAARLCAERSMRNALARSLRPK